MGSVVLGHPHVMRRVERNTCAAVVAAAVVVVVVVAVAWGGHP